MVYTCSALLLSFLALTGDATAAAVSRAAATPVANSGKRGLAYNDASLTSYYSLSGQNSKVSWAYNWGYKEWSSNLNTALEYIPTLWSNDASLTSAWSAAAQAAINSGSKALFSFNEPDLCVSGSSCMSVASSIAAYKQYMQPFAGKALLGAPAVTNGASTSTQVMGLDYLSAFISGCTGCQIDFINIHWYSNKYAGINYLMSHVEAARVVANGRPIWITEYALDSSVSYSEAELETFMEQSMSWLDAQSDVHGYAYFMNSAGILINSAGNGLSAAGQLWNTYTNVTTTAKTTSTTKTTTSTTKSTTKSTTTSTAAKTTASTTAKTTIKTTASTASQTTLSASAVATPLKIISAFFADQNVTTQAIASYQKGSSIILNSNTMIATLGTDPWPNTIKSISVLYTAGTDTRLFVATGQTGTYTLTAGTIPAALANQVGSAIAVASKPAKSLITIVAVQWGGSQITNSTVWVDLYNYAVAGTSFKWCIETFGADTFPNHSKSGVVWFKWQNGTLGSISGKGQTYSKFY